MFCLAILSNKFGELNKLWQHGEVAEYQHQFESLSS